MMTGIDIGNNVDVTNLDIDQTVNAFNPGTMDLEKNLFSKKDQKFFNEHSNFK